MKLALLLPGYLDSPDYLHMLTFEKKLKNMGYLVERIDPCDLWNGGGKPEKYTITNYINQIENRVNYYKKQTPKEVILIGHSLGAFVALIAGNRIKAVTKIVSLCSAADRIGSALNWKGKKNRHSTRELPNNSDRFREFDIPDTFAKDGMQYSAVKEVRKIHKPLMIFIALNDKSVPPKETERVVENAINPYVVRQTAMGHDFRKSQEECDIVMKEIEKFLEQ